MNNKAGNPWEREEREKEQEIRRDQMRHWRDQQINELSSMQRSPQQEEQLKTLILERDFERRAQLDEEEEEADGQPEGMMNGTDGKDPDQLVMSPPIAQSITAANAATTIQPKSILKHNTGGGGGVAVGLNNGADGSGSSGSMGSPSHSNQSSPMKQPPKTASFSDQVMTHRHLSFDGTDQMNNNPVLSQLTKEMTHLAMTPEGMMEHYQLTQQQQQELYPEYPPPPPERNSSYVFMSQQQQKLRTHQQQKQQMLLVGGGGGQQFENAINNNIVGGGGAVNGQHFMNGTAGPISPTGGGGGGGPTTAAAGYPNNGASNGNFMIPPPANFNTNMVRGDNKRVSFHDEDNNNLLLAAGQGEGYSAAGDLSKIREDPDVS